MVGSPTASEARRLRENGGYAAPMLLYLDALSVHAAIAATFVKTPAENGVFCHLLFIRELLDYGILHALVWVDARDMLADGMTKGAVDRSAIHTLMEGKVELTKEWKFWRPSQFSTHKE